MKTTEIRTRFRVLTFTNRGGSVSYRVIGTKRSGERVRKNFLDAETARQKQAELEAEFLRGQTETALRTTRLSESQIGVAEAAFTLLENENDLLRAIEYWRKYGKQNPIEESPTADEALAAFKDWLKGKADPTGNGICRLRPLTRYSLKSRVEAFVNSLGLVRIADVSPEMIENFLGKLDVSAGTKIGYKLAASRFFAWCIARPRRWRNDNPCLVIELEADEPGTPEILTVEQVEKLLRAAEPEKLANYIAIAVFAGLRPWEIRRLKRENVNLKDREIRVDGKTSKTGRSRVVRIDDTLAAWLEAYKSEPIFPPDFQHRFEKAVKAAGIKHWPVDALRHTAISHYFRKSGSYGLTAEFFGNSEAIIKAHYAARTSSEETAKFYALKPTTKT